MTENVDQTPYNMRILGNTVNEVLNRFYNHPGVMDKKPEAFDVHQGFTLFLSEADSRLYRKEPGVMIPLTAAQEAEFVRNIGAGAVEIYLVRPSAGLPPYPVSEKIVIHGATLKAIPFVVGGGCASLRKAAANDVDCC